MARSSTPGMSIDALIGYLFDGAAGDSLAEELGGWLASSRRFRAFAEAHRDKVRKKLRGAAVDPESRRDIRAELRVAQLLLVDRHIELAFEAYGPPKGGPDFTVTFGGERSFNLEVTRQRRAAGDARGYGGPLLAKLRQLPPSAPNAVLVAIEGDDADAFDVAVVTRALRARADGRDEDFFTARGLKGTRGFHDRFLRLGSVLVWCEGATGDARASAWTNRSARIAVPERAVRASLVALRAG